MKILCKKSNNNPCLLGTRGLGFTLIVQELVRRIASDSAQSRFHGKKVKFLPFPKILGTVFSLLICLDIQLYRKQLMKRVTERIFIKNLVVFFEGFSSLLYNIYCSHPYEKSQDHKGRHSAIILGSQRTTLGSRLLNNIFNMIKYTYLRDLNSMFMSTIT